MEALRAARLGRKSGPAARNSFRIPITMLTQSVLLKSMSINDAKLPDEGLTNSIAPTLFFRAEDQFG